MVASFLTRAGSLGGPPLLDGSESDGTNLFSGTNAMTSGWTTVAATFTNAATTAPDGTTTASSLIETTDNDRHIIFQFASGLTLDAPVRYSIYAKAAGRRYLQLIYPTNTGTLGSSYVYYDLQTGTITDSGVTGGSQSVTNASIYPAVNGFYKCTGDHLGSAGTSSGFFSFSLSDVATYGAPLSFDSPVYTGDGTSGAYLWRPKLVQL